MQSQALSPEQSEWWGLERVVREVGLSRATLYRRIAAGTFPKRHEMRGTKRKVWFEAEVRQWKREEVQFEPGVPVAGGLGDLL